MAGYKSVTKNNICAHLDLDTPNAKHYAEIITFLRRSRIFTAISTMHVPYRSHQQDFWDMEQALQFMRVIRICICLKIHVGADWKAISEKYFKKDTSKS
ncbi:hypothetical protein R6Q59_028041, partial [Mikania micrantha]